MCAASPVCNACVDLIVIGRGTFVLWRFDWHLAMTHACLPYYLCAWADRLGCVRSGLFASDSAFLWQCFLVAFISGRASRCLPTSLNPCPSVPTFWKNRLRPSPEDCRARVGAVFKNTSKSYVRLCTEILVKVNFRECIEVTWLRAVLVQVNVLRNNYINCVFLVHLKCNLVSPTMACFIIMVLLWRVKPHQLLPCIILVYASLLW